jgi:tetratricopeptide (TPR) repeat protein
MLSSLQEEVFVAAKKEGLQSGTSEGANMLEEAFATGIGKLEEALKSVPADKLKAAKQEADKFLKGDLSWLDLTQYTPERLTYIAEMGYHQFHVGQYDSAEKLFKGLTVIDPGNYYYHQMLGATLQRKDKNPEAILEYSIATDLNPQDIVSLTNRGEVYFKLGITELATEDFDKAIALDPKNEDRWANRARMLRDQLKLMKKTKK